MFSIRTTGATAGSLIAAALLVAGCGSSSTTGSTATTAAPAAATVAVRTASIGSVVVDGSGKTLYEFDKDTAHSESSACTGACATTWPPEQVSGPATAGAGVPGTVGVITRSDGSQQVTLDGHPLYHFSGDKAPGDTNGNGIGGIWHVVPGGSTTGAATTGPATTSTTTRSGFGY